MIVTVMLKRLPEEPLYYPKCIGTIYRTMADRMFIKLLNTVIEDQMFIKMLLDVPLSTPTHIVLKLK